MIGGRGEAALACSVGLQQGEDGTHWEQDRKAWEGAVESGLLSSPLGTQCSVCRTRANFNTKTGPSMYQRSPRTDPPCTCLRGRVLTRCRVHGWPRKLPSVCTCLTRRIPPGGFDVSVRIATDGYGTCSVGGMSTTCVRPRLFSGKAVPSHCEAAVSRDLRCLLNSHRSTHWSASTTSPPLGARHVLESSPGNVLCFQVAAKNLS